MQMQNSRNVNLIVGRQKSGRSLIYKTDLDFNETEWQVCHDTSKMLI